MEKIPTLFKRDPNNMRFILRDVHPDCQWVLDGEGVATRKYDGTCCLIKDGELYKRREIKKGMPIPPDFMIAARDEVTGKTVGWIQVEPASPEDKWHAKAFKEGLPNGTYELLGPKIQGNPEKLDEHTLLKHSDAEQFMDVPRSYDELREWMLGKDIEGIVFHHSDGRMAKIKKRDYGMKRLEPTASKEHNHAVHT